MDKSMIERYKEELLRMSGRKKAVVAEALPTVTEPPPPNDRNGGLVVEATALRSIYPVSGAEVTVFTGEGETARIIDKAVTDQSGKTKRFVLETPPRSASLDSASTTLPYSLYNLRVRAEGYIDNIHLNVPVFSGITSVQQSEMMLLETAGEDRRPQIFDETPQFNLN